MLHDIALQGRKGVEKSLQQCYKGKKRVEKKLRFLDNPKGLSILSQGQPAATVPVYHRGNYYE
jgi:hypothetical protein